MDGSQISFYWRLNVQKTVDDVKRKTPTGCVKTLTFPWDIIDSPYCTYNENWKFKREFINILVPLWQAAVQACGGWHVCLGTFLLWPKLLCQLWAPFSPILCALWGESKSLECLFQQSEAENIPAAFDIILPHDAGRYKLDQARVGARACAHKRVGVGHLACGYPRAGLQSACASRADRGIVRKGWAQLLLQLKFTSIIPKGDRCAYI